MWRAQTLRVWTLELTHAALCDWQEVPTSPMLGKEANQAGEATAGGALGG